MEILTRTGREEGSGGEKGRNSKDDKINRDEKKLVELIEDKGWSIFNGNVSGNEEGEYIFTGGKGYTVIDYVIGDQEVRGRIKRISIGDRINRSSPGGSLDRRKSGKEEERGKERKSGEGDMGWGE